MGRYLPIQVLSHRVHHLVVINRLSLNECLIIINIMVRVRGERGNMREIITKVL